VFFTKKEAEADDFRISVIADVSCDLQIPIPSTLRSSTLDDPFYDYSRKTGREKPAFSDADNITVMAVDNLPGALPADASESFGEILLEKVFPSLFGTDTNKIIERGTILDKGRLGAHFDYLENFLF
jgi:alanine dehydrogenase